MKRLVYIFIPVLAVLLMSHNTFAANLYDPYTCYALADGTIPCNQYGITTGNETTVISISKSNLGNISGYVNQNHTFIWAFRVQSTSALYINLANGYPSMWDLMDIQQDCNTVNGNNICNVVVFGKFKVNDWNIQLAGSVFAAGASYNIRSIYFSTSDYQYYTTDSIWHIVNSINTYLRNNPTASAQDIADAVNAPEEEASQNISDQSTSDIDAGDSSSATNLLGNIQGIFNQINGIPVGNTCSIPADFGHLDLGNINFCTGKDKLPFPVTFGAYCFELIFVIGTSIILIKQVLSILDWSRR